MVECLIEANKTENGLMTSKTGVKVLTSVSKVNISFNKTKDLPHEEKNPTRLPSKSFKNITMNNTIGVGGKAGGGGPANYIKTISFEEAWPQNRSLESAVRLSSRKISKQNDNVVVDELASQVAADVAEQETSSSENNQTKEVFRKIKLHSDSEGFRSPLKQINNQLTAAAASCRPGVNKK